MKILFLGDIMFGHNNNKFIDNPFKYIENILKSVMFIESK